MSTGTMPPPPRRGRGRRPAAIIVDRGGEAAERDGPVRIAPDAHEVARRDVALAGVLQRKGELAGVPARRGDDAKYGTKSSRCSRRHDLCVVHLRSAARQMEAKKMGTGHMPNQARKTNIRIARPCHVRAGLRFRMVKHSQTEMNCSDGHHRALVRRVWRRCGNTEREVRMKVTIRIRPI